MLYMWSYNIMIQGNYTLKKKKRRDQCPQKIRQAEKVFNSGFRKLGMHQRWLLLHRHSSGLAPCRIRKMYSLLCQLHTERSATQTMAWCQFGKRTLCTYIPVPATNWNLHPHSTLSLVFFSLPRGPGSFTKISFILLETF